jgi:hypothetical protein
MRVKSLIYNSLAESSTGHEACISGKAGKFQFGRYVHT